MDYIEYLDYSILVGVYLVFYYYTKDIGYY